MGGTVKTSNARIYIAVGTSTKQRKMRHTLNMLDIFTNMVKCYEYALYLYKNARCKQKTTVAAVREQSMFTKRSNHVCKKV